VVRCLLLFLYSRFSLFLLPVVVEPNFVLFAFAPFAVKVLPLLLCVLWDLCG